MDTHIISLLALFSLFCFSLAGCLGSVQPPLPASGPILTYETSNGFSGENSNTTVYANGSVEYVSYHRQYSGNSEIYSPVKTAHLQLSADELAKLKQMLSQTDYTRMKERYSCFETDEADCPYDLSAQTLFFYSGNSTNLGGSTKSVSMYFSKQTPASITALMSEMAQIRGRMTNELI